MLGVSSLSISRWEVEAGRRCTRINVGELAERDERWPQDETYAPADVRLAPAGGGVIGVAFHAAGSARTLLRTAHAAQYETKRRRASSLSLDPGQGVR